MFPFSRKIDYLLAMILALVLLAACFPLRLARFLECFALIMLNASSVITLRSHVVRSVSLVFQAMNSGLVLFPILFDEFGGNFSISNMMVQPQARNQRLNLRAPK